MSKNQDRSRGFTLIAALLLTILLSGVAVGLLYMVGNEARMGGNDLEGRMSYYAAEAGMENLTALLSQAYTTSQSPNVATLQALTNSSNYPTNVTGSNIANVSYTESMCWPAMVSGQVVPCQQTASPYGTHGIVGAGQDAGMPASVIPFTLTVTATRLASAGQVADNSGSAASGASTTMNRTVEVALLPAFEFGIFCDGDCDYFAGPNFNFGGRVHTNNNLFLASGSKLTFTDKISAVGQVILDRLENGHLTSSGYTGAVYVPSAAGACPPAPGAGPAANCNQLTAGSWTGGFPPVGSANSGWPTISTQNFNGFIINGVTGAKKLQLPFVQSSTVGAIDIIRRPQAGDSTQLANARLYAEATIRILLADSLSDLHPERGTGQLDSNDVQLGPATQTGSPVGYSTSAGTEYIATATSGTGSWVTPTASPACASGSYSLMGQVTQSTPCVGTWLRVEYFNGTSWVGVTQEWLSYGFGRQYNYPPTAPYGSASACPFTGTVPGQCYNPISPAILIVQQLQSTYTTAASAVGSGSQTHWLPINFYDAREGEPRDQRSSSTSTTACSPAGVMNVVELDAGNLWLWLQHKAPYASGSGNLVSQVNQSGNNENGWILYFSDHRGMQGDPNPTGTNLYNHMTGMSGLEDTINSASSSGVPDNLLETATYYSFSPEDVNADTYLDTWGAKYLPAGFGLALGNGTMAQSYYIAGTTTGISNCATTAAWNMVTGPRHALRLVDGGMNSSGTSYLPIPNTGQTSGNGFTVASEEPVYVYGDYNSGLADPFFTSGGTNLTTPHSAAAIIADAVTLLSNPPSSTNSPTPNVGWTDSQSFALPYCATKNTSPPSGMAACATGRYGNNSYYRVAIAAGKSIPFPQPSWAGQDFGTDGGMHNFLRYLEDRGDNGNGGTVNYAGSLISMYYSQYATGAFKCCNAVYGAPVRNYFFDTLFLNPDNLPPGTPMFQDVVNLSYHEGFAPQ